MHRVNEHANSTRCSTEADGKHFENGVLKTITNITRSMVNRKKDFFTGVFQRFSS